MPSGPHRKRMIDGITSSFHGRNAVRLRAREIPHASTTTNLTPGNCMTRRRGRSISWSSISWRSISGTRCSSSSTSSSSGQPIKPSSSSGQPIKPSSCWRSSSGRPIKPTSSLGTTAYVPWMSISRVEEDPKTFGRRASTRLILYLGEIIMV